MGSRGGNSHRRCRRRRLQQVRKRFPNDLIAEILARVPYRSLCRFKCVSRAWLALGSEPSVWTKCPQSLSGCPASSTAATSTNTGSPALYAYAASPPASSTPPEDVRRLSLARSRSCHPPTQTCTSSTPAMAFSCATARTSLSEKDLAILSAILRPGSGSICRISGR